MLRSHFLLIGLVFPFFCAAQKLTTIGLSKRNAVPPYHVHGSIYSVDTGEPIIGATIYLERQDKGTNSDGEGDYAFELHPGAYEIRVSAIGYQTLTKWVNVKGPGIVNFPLSEQIIELDEVVLESNQKDNPISNSDLGTEYLEVASIKTLPMIGGELNLLNTLTLLPGVSSPGEAAGGLNIRGGGSDQNLIMIGDAVVYNPFHLFGFFSGFNANIVRDVTLHKGMIPANYGGRASSIIDLSYGKGNFKEWEADINLGTVASKFAARGPLFEDKIAVAVAGRIAYPNWLLQQARDPNIANSTASFFDHNLVLTYSIDDKNSLEYSHYLSGDDFQFPTAIKNQWMNRAHVIKWQTEFSNKLLFDLSLTNSNYTSTLTDDTPLNSFDVDRKIDHTDINAHFQLLFSESNELKAGAQLKRRNNEPGRLVPGSNSSVLPQELESEQAYETGVYFHHEFEPFSRLLFSYGLRYSTFSYRGPQEIVTYQPGQPKSSGTAIGSIQYGEEKINSYDGFEPRVGINYRMSSTFSFKLGYSRLYQYIHQLTNTASISPTDQWKFSDPYILPQITSGYSAGLFKSFQNNRIQASVQGFYREQQNLLEYKDGAEIILNPTIETELLTASGRAYGLELLIDKPRGKSFGWLSYTYSRSLRTVEGSFEEETINGGNEYPSNFDQPHNLSFVFNHRLGEKVVFSSIFNYSTGRPFTLPQGKFEYNDTELAYYALRNGVRAPDTHRLDLSLQFGFNSEKKILSGQWTFSVYNVYGRKNPFSVFFQDFPGSPPRAYQLSIVGSPFPSLSYEFNL